MIRNLAKLVAFRKAPRTTLAVLSPRRFVKWGLALFLVKKLVESFRSA